MTNQLSYNTYHIGSYVGIAFNREAFIIILNSLRKANIRILHNETFKVVSNYICKCTQHTHTHTYARTHTQHNTHTT